MTGNRGTPPPPSRYHVTVGGTTLDVEIDGSATSGADGTVVRVDDREFEAHLLHHGETPRYRLTLDGRTYRVVARKEARGRWRLVVDGHPADVRVESERERVIARMASRSGVAGGPEPVRAPMPGLVVKIEVDVGDRVEPGDGLVVVEAMKMENELTAKVAATVRDIRVREGDSVEKDTMLIEFEDAARTGPDETPDGDEA